MLLQMPFLELLYLHRLVNCSCRCFFLLICKNIHPQLVFSLLADTLLQKFASATSLFSILQILSCKNLHPQLPFSLSCRYSPSKICIHNLPFLYLADTPLQKICIRNLLFLYLADTPLFQHTLLLNYSGFLLNYYFDF